MNGVKAVFLSVAFLAAASAGSLADEVSLSCVVTETFDHTPQKKEYHIFPQITDRTYVFGGSVKQVGRDDLKISFSPTLISVEIILKQGQGTSMKDVISIDRTTGAYRSDKYWTIDGETKRESFMSGHCEQYAVNKKF